MLLMHKLWDMNYFYMMSFDVMKVFYGIWWYYENMTMITLWLRLRLMIMISFDDYDYDYVM